MSARLYVYSVDLKDNTEGRRAQKDSPEKITESAIWHLPLIHTAAGASGWNWFYISCWQDKWPPKDKILTQKNKATKNQQQRNKRIFTKLQNIQQKRQTENDQPKPGGGKNSGSQRRTSLTLLPTLSPPALILHHNLKFREFFVINVKQWWSRDGT